MSGDGFAVNYGLLGADVPAAACIAADAVTDLLESVYDDGWTQRDRDVMRVALEAAAPALRAQAAAVERKEVVGELIKRHGQVEDDNGWGSYCGVCWVKGGSRAVWPCAESVALADLLGGGTDG